MNLYIKLSVCVPRLIPGRGFNAQISSEITSEFPGVTYYNLTESKMEALRQEALKAEANAEKEVQRFAREMAKATESAKTVCRKLRLALTDMGASI